MSVWLSLEFAGQQGLCDGGRHSWQNCDDFVVGVEDVDDVLMLMMTATNKACGTRQSVLVFGSLADGLGLSGKLAIRWSKSSQLVIFM